MLLDGATLAAVAFLAMAAAVVGAVGGFGTGFAPFRGGPLHYLSTRKK